jgi:hypothetical protein
VLAFSCDAKSQLCEDTHGVLMADAGQLRHT